MTHTQMMVEQFPVCGSNFPADQNCGSSTRLSADFRFSDDDYNFNRQLVFMANIGENLIVNPGTFPTDFLRVQIEISPDGNTASYPLAGGSTPLWTEKTVELPPDVEHKLVSINVTPSELNAKYPSTAYPKAMIRISIDCRDKDAGGNMNNSSEGTYFNSFLIMGETLRYGLAGATNEALQSQMSMAGFKPPIGSESGDSELFLKAY